jgi:hypothetical protein
MKKNIGWKTRNWYFGSFVAASAFALVVLATSNSYSQAGGDKRVVRTVTTTTEYNVPRPGCTRTTTSASVDCPSGEDDCSPVVGAPSTVDNCPD